MGVKNEKEDMFNNIYNNDVYCHFHIRNKWLCNKENKG